jgi:hypothetical protein
MTTPPRSKITFFTIRGSSINLISAAQYEQVVKRICYRNVRRTSGEARRGIRALGATAHVARGETEKQLLFARCNIELSVGSDNCGRFFSQVYWPQRKGKPVVRRGRKASGLER